MIGDLGVLLPAICRQLMGLLSVVLLAYALGLGRPPVRRPTAAATIDVSHQLVERHVEQVLGQTTGSPGVVSVVHALAAQAHSASRLPAAAAAAAADLALRLTPDAAAAQLTVGAAAPWVLDLDNLTAPVLQAAVPQLLLLGGSNAAAARPGPQPAAPRSLFVQNRDGARVARFMNLGSLKAGRRKDGGGAVTSNKRLAPLATGRPAVDLSKVMASGLRTAVAPPSAGSGGAMVSIRLDGLIPAAAGAATGARGAALPLPLLRMSWYSLLMWIFACMAMLFSMMARRLAGMARLAGSGTGISTSSSGLSIEQLAKDSAREAGASVQAHLRLLLSGGGDGDDSDGDGEGGAAPLLALEYKNKDRDTNKDKVKNKDRDKVKNKDRDKDRGNVGARDRIAARPPRAHDNHGRSGSGSGSGSTRASFAASLYSDIIPAVVQAYLAYRASDDAAPDRLGKQLRASVLPTGKLATAAADRADRVKLTSAAMLGVLDQLDGVVHTGSRMHNYSPKYGPLLEEYIRFHAQRAALPENKFTRVWPRTQRRLLAFFMLSMHSAIRQAVEDRGIDEAEQEALVMHLMRELYAALKIRLGLPAVNNASRNNKAAGVAEEAFDIETGRLWSKYRPALLVRSKWLRAASPSASAAAMDAFLGELKARLNGHEMPREGRKELLMLFVSMMLQPDALHHAAGVVETDALREQLRLLRQRLGHSRPAINELKAVARERAQLLVRKAFDLRLTQVAQHVMKAYKALARAVDRWAGCGTHRIRSKPGSGAAHTVGSARR